MAVEGEFCAPHARRAELAVEPDATSEPEAVEPVDAVEVPGEEPEAVASVDDEEEGVPPEQLRARFAERAGKREARMIAALEEAMTGAVKDAWLTCKTCGKKDVYTAPDHRTRLEAVSKWVELGLGRKTEKAQDAGEEARVVALSKRWGSHVYEMTAAERSEEWRRLFERHTWFSWLGRLSALEFGALVLLECEQLAAEQRDGKPRPGFAMLLEVVTGQVPEPGEDAEALIARHDELVRDLQKLEALKRVKDNALCGVRGFEEELFPATELRPHQQREAA